MNLSVEQSVDGVILRVHAQPGAKTNGITGLYDGAVKVAVTQAPEKGKANRALMKVLSAELGLKGSQVILVSGPTSTRKRFLVKDVELSVLKQLIRKAAVIERTVAGQVCDQLNSVGLRLDFRLVDRGFREK